MNAKLNKMRKIFLYDLYRYVGPECKKLTVRLRYILFTPGIQYTYLLRKSQRSRFSLFRKCWNLLLHIDKIITGIQIPPSTRIGFGFRILHFGNIVINPQAQIGYNCNISQGVLIGGSDGAKKGYPVIGNNCCIFANAIVLGGIKIGDNVLIAPGAFVNFDVPENSTVIGNPGKIIPRPESPTRKYILYDATQFQP